MPKRDPVDRSGEVHPVVEPRYRLRYRMANEELRHERDEHLHRRDEGGRNVKGVRLPTLLGEDPAPDRIPDAKMQKERYKEREGQPVEQIDREVKILARSDALDIRGT